MAVDIWAFYGYGGKVKITCANGSVYTGQIADVVDKNERDDDPYPEDYVDLYSDAGGIIGFDESEIATIEKVENVKR